MNELIQKVQNRKSRIALVGATNDKTKFGNIIYHDLKKKGYTVYPINPKASTIDGDRVYHNLKEIEEAPDIINIVIPPKLALEFIKNAIKDGYNGFWLQPGASDENVIEFLKSTNANYLTQKCIMVES